MGPSWCLNEAPGPWLERARVQLGAQMGNRGSHGQQVTTGPSHLGWGLVFIQCPGQHEPCPVVKVPFRRAVQPQSAVLDSSPRTRWELCQDSLTCALTSWGR